jgi:4'-phosphopantetheinyl transferase EntD
MIAERARGDGLQVEEIARLFTRPVSVSVADETAYELAPMSEELAAVARAVEKRRREFAAGRACARRALAQLGQGPVAIPVGPERAPVWPPGYVGSITHCEGFCCAVAASKDRVAGLGIDVEDASPLEPRAARLVLRPDEGDAFKRMPAPVGTNWAKLAFGAKEAAIKCYRPLVKGRLGFQEVMVRFSGNGAFEACLGSERSPAPGLPVLEGRWRIWGGRIYAGATAPSSG